MSPIIKDAKSHHWVYRAPKRWRPYLQLARYDRPIGYWLLALPGWMGIALADFPFYDLSMDGVKWAFLILIGAIAMRGAGCTYNDIIDKELDAQVERTAARPIPSGTVSLKQAWIWLLVQCIVGLIILLCFPPKAQIVALLSLPLILAYPFMKRITWWPQIWLGLTFNWAALVAYVTLTGTLTWTIIILYIGLVFWTLAYDTIYACQDKEDDALIGIKSSALRLDSYVKPGIGLFYALFILLTFLALMANSLSLYHSSFDTLIELLKHQGAELVLPSPTEVLWGFIIFNFILILPMLIVAGIIMRIFNPDDSQNSLKAFKANAYIPLAFIIPLLGLSAASQYAYAFS